MNEKQVQSTLLEKSYQTFKNHKHHPGAGAARPFLLQCLVQDVLLVQEHPMEVPHLLLVLSWLASKVLLLLCQMVIHVIQLQCHLLLVPLGMRMDSVRGCCLGPRGWLCGCAPSPLLGLSEPLNWVTPGQVSSGRASWITKSSQSNKGISSILKRISDLYHA